MSALITRRIALLLIAGLALGQTSPALAKKGGSDNSGSGSDDNDDNDNSGSGSDDNDDQNNIHGDKKSNDTSNNRRKRSEQDGALAAVRSGKAVPLQRVLNHCKSTYKGKVLDVKLKQRDERYVYEVRILAPNNFVRFIRLDAKSLNKI